MTLQKMCNGIDISESVSIKGELVTYHSGEEVFQEITLQKGDPKYDQIIELFREKRFRQPPMSQLKRDGTSKHPLTEGDRKWSLTFSFDEITMKNGVTALGDLIRISDFYGELFMWNDGTHTICKTANQKAWADEVAALIAE